MNSNVMIHCVRPTGFFEAREFEAAMASPDWTGEKLIRFSVCKCLEDAESYKAIFETDIVWFSDVNCRTRMGPEWSVEKALKNLLGSVIKETISHLEGCWGWYIEGFFPQDERFYEEMEVLFGKYRRSVMRDACTLYDNDRMAELQLPKYAQSFLRSVIFGGFASLVCEAERIVLAKQKKAERSEKKKARIQNELVCLQDHPKP